MTHRHPLRPRAAGSLALALFLAACGGKAPPAGPAPTTAAEAPRAISPLRLGGQPLLVLPAQGLDGVGLAQAQVTEEIVAALRARDGVTRFVDPDELRRALRRAPGYANDPALLPHDPYRRHGDRMIAGALADVVRRYGALVDVRLVMIPRAARYLPPAEGATEGRIRLDAAIVDSRTGGVVWYGEADGAAGPAGDVETLRSAAAALAARMLAPPGV